MEGKRGKRNRKDDHRVPPLSVINPTKLVPVLKEPKLCGRANRVISGLIDLRSMGTRLQCSG